MNFRHFAILALWTAIVLVVTGTLLFLFTFGDCVDNQMCRNATNRNFALIAGSTFVVYWIVFIALVRRWNR